MNLPKTLALALAATLALAACGGAPAPAVQGPIAAAAAEPAPAPASPAGMALVERHLAAFNAHDIDGAGAMLHEDVLYLDATFGEAQRGRMAAVDNLISPWVRAMPDLEWVLRGEPIVQGDGIAYEWTLTGTNTGPFMGIEGKNQKVELQGMSFVRVKDGQIVYKADYYDAATLGKQLGWK